MDYAVIRTGGKQYRVAPGDLIRIEKLAGDAGSPVAFTEVLMASGAGNLKVGAPLVAGVRVTGEIVRQGRAKKILVFKKKRRKNYRRHQGHRQYETTVRVTAIESE
ncbi:MAG TPA: 50S ribosomal protein L21 [Candidatus Kryptonia bacterium]|nr:50S ribosomal protein L21 [Candidatus Kryptonia bacterium]